MMDEYGAEMKDIETSERALDEEMINELGS